MAAAYAYAEGDGRKPRELSLLETIDRFGVQGVMGRTLGKGEIRRMIACQNIVAWHAEKGQSANWAQWAEDNPERDEMLNTARRLAQEMGLLDA
jgi:hypothetical protein